MTMIEIIAMIATGVLCVLCVICIAAIASSKRQANENKRAIKDIRDRLGTFGDSINEKTDQLFERLDKQQFDDFNERRLEALEEEIRQLAKAEEEIANVVSAAGAGAIAGEEDYIGPDDIEELDDEIDLDDLFRELSAMEEVEFSEEFDEQLEEEPAAAAFTEPVPQTQQPEPVTQAVKPETVFQPIQPEPVIQLVQPEPDIRQQIAAQQVAAQQVSAQQPVQQAAAQQPEKQWPAVQPQPVQPQPELPADEPRKVTRYHQGYNVGRSGRKYTAEELNVLIRE